MPIHHRVRALAADEQLNYLVRFLLLCLGAAAGAHRVGAPSRVHCMSWTDAVTPWLCGLAVVALATLSSARLEDQPAHVSPPLHLSYTVRVLDCAVTPWLCGPAWSLHCVCWTMLARLGRIDNCVNPLSIARLEEQPAHISTLTPHTTSRSPTKRQRW
jgi:hypothetical protein